MLGFAANACSEKGALICVVFPKIRSGKEHFPKTLRGRLTEYNDVNLILTTSNQVVTILLLF